MASADEPLASRRMRRRPLLTASEGLPARLRHVRWIGGGSGAGKSTIARQLALAHGLRQYSCDATLAAHAARLHPADAPLLQAFLTMDMDERWLNRPPELMLKTFPWFAGEGFDLILDDLLALPQEPLILVEGFRLLPLLVAPLLSAQHQALWLAPTSAFRIAAFERRDFTWEIPNKTSQPERALSNLLMRDQLFTEQMVAEAIGLGLCIIGVDGARSIEAMTRLVAELLDLAAR
ncbi:MAG TPA: hypothetical protein VFN78_11465 [Ktedonobacterales bacterium]|nr:hypothetical protein [Ktedonobacterales bacterium]